MLNFITRPLGGVLSDLIAKRFSNSKLQARKCELPSSIRLELSHDSDTPFLDLLVTLVILQGIFSIWIGIVDPPDSPTLLVGITFLAIFVEMGNGACCKFSLSTESIFDFSIFGMNTILMDLFGRCARTVN